MLHILTEKTAGCVFFMWTARICLWITLLLGAGGWFDALMKGPRKIAVLSALAVVCGLSFVPTVREPIVRVCAAPCAFALLCALLCPTEHPLGAASAAVLGGIVGWKLLDTFPLFAEPGLLIALPTLLFAALYARDKNAAALAVAASPFVMLLFRMAGDWMLFNSAVLELGNADALAAQAMGLLLLLACGAFVKRREVRRAHAAA